jgi:hypothetical protein
MVTLGMPVASHPDLLYAPSGVSEGLAQLPQLRGYSSPNLVISHSPVKKVVTTNLVFCIFWAVLA